MVIDVGYTIELYAEFSQTGGIYTPFPDPLTYRIRLADLAKPEVREQLALVWTAPLTLDPAKRAAKVTREIAAKLAELAKSLEACQHNPQDVAHFLMRCLFTMFAEDVGLLDHDSFKNLLKQIKDPAGFAPTMQELWSKMNIGGYCVALSQVVKRFNGGLFADSRAIPLTRDQLNLLIEAAEKKWNDVEPAIFGTLLERAEEERGGIIRYLRPEFQNPQGQTQKQIAVEADNEEDTKKKGKAAKAKPAKKLSWPKALSEQAAAVQSVLVSINGPASEADVAKRFTRANKDRVAELLDTLTSLGKARELDDGRYLAV